MDGGYGLSVIVALMMVHVAVVGPGLCASSVEVHFSHMVHIAQWSLDLVSPARDCVGCRLLVTAFTLQHLCSAASEFLVHAVGTHHVM